MTQLNKLKTEKHRAGTKGKDSLDRIRAAVQELHGALSDAVGKSGDAMEADLKAIPKKASVIAESIKESVEVQNKASEKHLLQAVAFLESTEKHIATSLKSTGKELQTSMRQALADARAAAQRVSEGLAAKRTAEATHSHR